MMQETYNALTSLKNKIERLEAVENKMAEIEEVIKNAGIGQGADLEAYYRIQEIVRANNNKHIGQFNEDDHKKSSGDIRDLIKMNRSKGKEDE